MGRARTVARRLVKAEMNKLIAKWTLGLALIVPAVSVHAADVTLSNWLYGNGALVAVSDPSGLFRGRAGALVATVSGADGFDAAPFVTFSVEYGTGMRLGSSVSGYSVVAGASYFDKRLHDAGIAEQIAQLMTYADDHTGLVNNASGSASLQLALWSVIQDHAAATPAGAASKTSLTSNNVGAQSLLSGSNTVTDSRYDVWVLEGGAGTDLLLLSLRAPTFAALSETVPEPGSLALAITALAGLGLAAKRRRR
jgi:hypothetical protein